MGPCAKEARLAQPGFLHCSYATYDTSGLELEIGLAVEDRQGIGHIVIRQRNGRDGFGQANGLIQAAHMDITPGSIAARAADVDLVV